MKNSVRFKSAAALAVLSASAVGVSCSQDLKWSAAEKMIDTRFTDVRHITPDSLQAALADTTRQILLLDTREAEEYSVSHIAGAVQVDPDERAFDFLATVDRDTPIVTYCSIGYRSSAVAERLTEKGFADVSNLRGSIFRWANEGRPLVHNGESVQEVHPYDRVWGQLLKPELHAREPGTSD